MFTYYHNGGSPALISGAVSYRDSVFLIYSGGCQKLVLNSRARAARVEAYFNELARLSSRPRGWAAPSSGPSTSSGGNV